MRASLTGLCICVVVWATACTRNGAGEVDTVPAEAAPRVTVSADEAMSPVPAWRPVLPAVDVGTRDGLHARAAIAMAEGPLYGSDGEDAASIYLALARADADDVRAARGLADVASALVRQGDRDLAALDLEGDGSRRAHEIAGVARVIGAHVFASRARTRRMQDRLNAYLARVDLVDEALRENRAGERELAADRIGELGGGALQRFQTALRLRPADPRAMQGLAASESALIRRAEAAAERNDFESVEYWLGAASAIRPDAGTVTDARIRIADARAAKVRRLRDAGIAALPQFRGIEAARQQLAELLLVAPTGDPAAVELRNRIELATHYGLFRPGQVFTDGSALGGRGPQLIVVPHGAFRMGAGDDDPDATDVEKPSRLIRFDRGFAMSRTEITVGQFRRFIEATSHRARANRRGFSSTYDERSGNFVRRGYVDWQRGYAGAAVADDMPVLHVSAKDAQAFAAWLSEQTGQVYRLPSEAEFEYVLRAGQDGRYPWSTTPPPARIENVTGALDISPNGRRWQNAFAGYGDGAWGPAPVGSYRPNRYGLHDVAGNVSEWVDDCWHAGYRRAPDDGRAWINPGCRARVVRGGSWASAPVQTRNSWRQQMDADSTHARIGFRVVREI